MIGLGPVQALKNYATRLRQQTSSSRKGQIRAKKIRRLRKDLRRNRMPTLARSRCAQCHHGSHTAIKTLILRSIMWEKDSLRLVGSSWLSANLTWVKALYWLKFQLIFRLAEAGYFPRPTPIESPHNPGRGPAK